MKNSRITAYIVAVAAFTAVVPVTNLVAGGKQRQRGRTEDDGQSGDDHFPRT